MANATLPPDAIRVVLAGIPGLIADIVRQYVRGQADVSIVGELRDATELSALARTQQIEVVVTTRAEEGVPPPCQQLLFGEPAVPVIAIGSDGRLEIYDRRILREAALNELLGEIRKVAARNPVPLI
jgi:hypothetical protein